MLLEVLAGAVGLAGVLFGAKLLMKARVAKTTELEYKEKAKGNAAVKQVSSAHEEAVADVHREAKEASRRPVSDVLVDLINSGEVSR